MAKKCDCAKWRNNITQLDLLILYANKHGYEVENIMFFKYCPWCGRKLKENWDIIDVYG